MFPQPNKAVEIHPWAFTFGNAFGVVHNGENKTYGQLLPRMVSLFCIMHTPYALPTTRAPSFHTMDEFT